MPLRIRLGLLTFAAVLAQAAEYPSISGLRCTRMNCAAVTGAVQAEGSQPGLANASLTFVVFDQAKKIVRNERVMAGADGSFRASVETGSLAPGRYTFGFITGAKPAATVACV
ncbi:MAG: hypothetical protein M1436_07085, partial [Acidobacteria bacterium]|nr:hypothetical protein [Acidobacteriota bacterium]